MKTVEEEFTRWQGRHPDVSHDPFENFRAGWLAIIEATGGPDHIAKVDDAGWTLQHPLTERLEGSLFDCQIPGLVGIAHDHGDMGEGMFKVWLDRGAFQWEEVS